MTIEYWLESAVTDAERRGLPQLKTILETLARATAALRAADFNDHASGERGVNGPRSRPNP
jgi:hypothetical protein